MNSHYCPAQSHTGLLSRSSDITNKTDLGHSYEVAQEMSAAGSNIDHDTADNASPLLPGKKTMASTRNAMKPYIERTSVDGVNENES